MPEPEGATANGWPEWKRVVLRHIEDEDEFQKEIRADMKDLAAGMVRLETKLTVFRWVVGLIAPAVVAAIVSFAASRF